MCTDVTLAGQDIKIKFGRNFETLNSTTATTLVVI